MAARTSVLASVMTSVANAVGKVAATNTKASANLAEHELEKALGRDLYPESFDKLIRSAPP